MRGLGKVAALLASAAIIAALVPAGAAETEQRATLVRGSGSDTTYFLLQKLDNAYNGSRGCFSEVLPGNTQPLDNSCVQDDREYMTTENVDHDVALSYYPLGSSNGIKQLCERGLAGVTLVDYARSSRAPKSSDCQGLRFVAFAKDAIPWASFKDVAGSASASVGSLTQQELKDIFVNCTITNWNQVGGADAEIIIYAAQAGSGTRGAYDGFVGGDSSTCIPDQYKDGESSNGERVIFENSCSPVLEADRANAIFYYSYGRFQTSGGEGCSLGDIDGVTASPETISDGSFPFSRFLYNVYRQGFASFNASEATLEYVHEDTGWLCKTATEHGVNPSTGKNYREEIETIMMTDGFVPLVEGAIGGGVAGTSHCRVTPIPSA